MPQPTREGLLYDAALDVVLAVDLRMTRLHQRSLLDAIERLARILSNEYPMVASDAAPIVPENRQARGIRLRTRSE
jgi:hypothetical protein